MKKIRKYYAIADYSHVGEWKDAGEAELKIVYEADSELEMVKKAKESIKYTSVPKLKLFDTIEDAISYSQDTALFSYPSGVDAFGKVKNHDARIYQAPVLEVNVSEDSIGEKLNEILEEKLIVIKRDRYRTIPPKKPKDYTYHEISNTPGYYTINSVRIRDSKPFIPPMKIPETYTGFFANKQNPILANVKRPFQDYSGKFYLFHWNRHHTKLADAIVKKINSLVSPEDAYTYLFEQRQNLIKAYSGIKSNWHTYGIEDLLKGSFLRRIDHALLQLSPFVAQVERPVNDKSHDHKSP
jgi:hypothetical protein